MIWKCALIKLHLNNWRCQWEYSGSYNVLNSMFAIYVNSTNVNRINHLDAEDRNFVFTTHHTSTLCAHHYNVNYLKGKKRTYINIFELVNDKLLRRIR